MATTVTDCGNVRIITQLIQQTGPQADGAATGVPGSTSITPQCTPAQIKSFKNTLPKALGVVQIVLGATQISFGIALTVAQGDFKSLSVKSGVYFWIGNLVKACFIANLIVTVAALVAAIIHTTEIAQVVKEETHCIAETMDTSYCSKNHQILSYGLNSVFIIFSLLEVSIAVTALVITFKSTRQQLYQQMVL